MIFRYVLLLYTFQLSSCGNLTKSFEKINNITVNFNALAAQISWELCMNPGNPELPARAAEYEKKRITWQSSTCDKLVRLKSNALLNSTQKRMTYLLCRGPKFTFSEAREMSTIYRNLQAMYDGVQICMPSSNLTQDGISDKEKAIMTFINAVKRVSSSELIDSILFAAKIAANSHFGNSFLCLKGEADFDKLMSHTRNEDVLKWLWLVWREKVRPTIKKDYKRLVLIENTAAKRNGYANIGAVWRDELETPLLRQLCLHLYSEIKPIYELLHGVVRFYLRKHYGNIIPEYGPIPAHLLGDLWSQDWEPLINLITNQNIDLDNSIKKMNWTVEHMVHRAEDFYMSLGLPPMPPKFWKQSIFTRTSSQTRCHGAAANMFQKNDYRLIYCSDTSMDDFYVIHHEMGHIHYYMSYEDQPGLFRQGANTAFHESIGDTIMIGVMAPLHLHRLGLINDSILYTTYARRERKVDGLYKNKKIINSASAKYRAYYKNSIFSNKGKVSSKGKYPDEFSEGAGIKSYLADFGTEITAYEILLLKQALKKIPNIPFSLLLDEYRWRYFEGSIGENELNKEFWRLTLELQGVMPPTERGEEYFDIAAKFHVPDNTPYIRYFLSSFIQYQLYESLCKTAVFGRRNFKDTLPDSILLSRCDIYGSKAAGKMLRDLMSRGGSKNWRETLFETTGQYGISAASIKQYYEPLQKLLWRLVSENNIPIGW